MKMTMRLLVLLLVTTLCRSHGADDLRQSELLRLLPGSGVNFAALVNLERCRAQELPMLPTIFSSAMRDFPEDVLDGMAELLILDTAGSQSPMVIICCRPKPDAEQELWEEFESDGEITILPTDIPGAEEIKVQEDFGSALVMRVSQGLWLFVHGRRGKAETLVPNIEKLLAQKEALDDAPAAMRALLNEVPAESMAIALWPTLNFKHGLHSARDIFAGLASPAEALIVNVLPGEAAKQIVVQARARYADAADAQVVLDGVKALKPLGNWLERSVAELIRRQETPVSHSMRSTQGFFNTLSGIAADLDGTLLRCALSLDLAQEPTASLFSGAPRAAALACVTNLKQIGLGIAIYATDHQDSCPDTLAALKPYLGNKRVLYCSAMRKKRRQDALYLYLLPPGTKLKEIKEPARTIAVMDNPAGPHPQLPILFADGHVQSVERGDAKTPADIAAAHNLILLPMPAAAE
ncbi:MAG: hypothetical protein GX945_14815 [Lentisphaerae bacterium]|nr:hypothetical protein [Lentisphaerota bacterium]